MIDERCPWVIKWGAQGDSVTRCDKPDGHSGTHEGPGLPQFPGQRVEWYPGDRREYLSGEAVAVSEPCDKCGHDWADHVVAVTRTMTLGDVDNVPAGGLIKCPLCDCVARWSLSADAGETG